MRSRYPLLALASLAPLAAAVVGLADPPAAKPAAPAGYPAAFECRWADTPITLDGAADEPAWQHAQVIDRFHLPWLGQAGRPAKAATRAKLLWDREYLYFAADMDDADLFADVTEHDGPTWNNDVFELFFKPAADKPGYFEFEVSAANTVLDAFFPKRDIAGIGPQLKVGDFAVETRVKLRGTLNKRDDIDKGWSVEGRIPWADFLRAGGRPDPGDEWGFALCRYDYQKDAKEPELSTVAPIRERKLSAFFHQHEDYAKLKFVGRDAASSATPVGLKERPPVATSAVVGSPEPPLPFRVRRAYPSLAPNFLIAVKAVPGTDQLLLIHEDRPWGHSVLSRVADDPAAKTADLVKLMDTPDKGTAYDLAFHPKFAENGYVYVGWNGDGKGKVKNKFCRVTRYTMQPKPPYTFDPKSAKLIIDWESDGHNGAAVCFGTDGMLYVTSGDGTSDSDTDQTGQRTDLLLAKVLRIDVDRPADGKAYSVPKDNPFVADKRFAPETFAYGMRNPWRICSDEKTGHIWLGQNGQDLWEYAHLVRPGDNYGWSVTEGSHPFYPERKAGPTPVTRPTIEHSHAEFRSLTGGVVYHGGKHPGLDGAYVYGDYSTGRVWAMKHDGAKPVWHKEVAAGRLAITCFAVNTRGELLICDHRGNGEGGLYTLEPTPKETRPSTFPRKLSDSGLFDAVPGHKLKPGVVPYSVNAPFWSDGLVKERSIALPPGGGIEFTASRGWNFPDRTVIVKSFAVEQEAGNAASRKWVETRFLTKQDGEWAGYTYLWNDAGTDAELVGPAGLDKELAVPVPKSAAHPDGVRKQVWHYPSRAECMVCHSRAQNFVLGLCTPQMNKPHAAVGSPENQIRAFERLGMFTTDWAKEARGAFAGRAAGKKLKDKAADEYVALHAPQPGQREAKPSTLFLHAPGKYDALVNPYDAKEDLTKRAKSWLHTNCSQCHVEAGGGNAKMELEFATALDKMRILDEKPVHQAFDLPDARLLAPGHPDRSVIVKRVGTRGPGQMPPLSTNRVDVEGLALLRKWAESLK